MDGISGSTNSLINLGMAMSNIRLKSDFSTSALKKGLSIQAQSPLSLVKSTQVPYPRTHSSQSRYQIDLVA